MRWQKQAAVAISNLRQNCRKGGTGQENLQVHFLQVLENQNEKVTQKFGRSFNETGGSWDVTWPRFGISMIATRGTRTQHLYISVLDIGGIQMSLHLPFIENLKHQELCHPCLTHEPNSCSQTCIMQGRCSIVE
jgi:hypothetical protein